MRLSLYFGELRASGGKTIGVGLLKALSERTWPHEITAYVPDDPDYKRFIGGSVRVIPIKSKVGAYNIIAHMRMRKVLSNDRQDAVLMLGNLGLSDSPCPQVVHIFNSWFLYSDSPAWKMLSVGEFLYAIARDYLIKRWLKCADIVIAQTPVMLERLNSLCSVPYEKMMLVPAGDTSFLSVKDMGSISSKTMRQSGHKTKVLCMARYMPHKNLDILLPVADKLLDMGRKDIGIFVTVSPAHGSPAKRFISKIRENGRDAVICNLGEVPFKDVRSCYDIAHALLLPTFLESFSNAYLDAMRSGAGIITSDMDFARVVCGDAALYVDPSDVSAVVSALLSLESDTVEWKKRVDIGKRRVDKFFLRWDEIAGKMVSALEKAADGLNAPDILDDPWMKEYQLLQRPDRMR